MPFALSLSKGKSRPYILRQAQDERTQDERIRRRSRVDQSHSGLDTLLTYRLVPNKGFALLSNAAYVLPTVIRHGALPTV